MDCKKQKCSHSSEIYKQRKKNDQRLLEEFQQLFFRCKVNFAQHRTWKRAYDLALAMATSVGKQTISGLICTKGHQHQDWTSDYRVFSKTKWDPESLFDVILQESLEHIEKSGPLVVAMDDTRIKKTGKKIPGTQYLRDPMSPPFNVNLIRALRFLQISALIPDSTAASAARAVPISFANIPPVPKPKSRASDEEIAQFKMRRKKENLSFHGVQQLKQVRTRLDNFDSHRSLIALVDGSFCNSNVLKNIPQRTTIIGRIRGDAKLHNRPDTSLNSGSGRKRLYGKQDIRPELVRKDDTPWLHVPAFAAGKHHLFRVKARKGLLWRKAGHETPLTLVIIAPLAYRKTKDGETLYRQPAYLVCTDPEMPVQKILQYYVWRWDIEVNFRDEKQLMGVGKAQVRNPLSVYRAPAFSVIVYSLLILSGLRAFGPYHVDPVIPLPKWRKVKKLKRVTTNQLRNTIRYELWNTSLSISLGYYSGFMDKQQGYTKSPKLNFAYNDSIFCVYN